MMQDSSASLFSSLLQSVSTELTLFIVSILVAVAFRGADFAQQIGLLKSPKALKLKPTRPQQGSSSSSSSSPGNGIPTHAPNDGSEAPTYGPDIGRKGQQEAAERLALAPDQGMSRKVWWLINCVTNNKDAEAVAVFDEFRASGKNSLFQDVLKCGKSRPVDVYSWLAQCAVRSGRTELIEVFVKDMTDADIRRPLFFYRRVMKSLASMKYFKEALSIYDLLKADGLEPDPVMLDCFVSFAEKLGDSHLAVDFFLRLATCSTASMRAYTSILQICQKQANWPESLALLRDMQCREVDINSTVLNIVLSTGVAAKQFDDAKALFQEFLPTGIVDVISYNTIMKGLSKQKCGAQAVKLLDEMEEAGLKPNTITFNTAIDAVVHSPNCIHAWRMLSRMVGSGLSPDKFTCSILMKGNLSGVSSGQLLVILDLVQSLTHECSPALCAPLILSVFEATAQMNDPCVTARAVAQIPNLRAGLPPWDCHRLLKVIMHD